MIRGASANHGEGVRPSIVKGDIGFSGGSNRAIYLDGPFRDKAVSLIGDGLQGRGISHEVIPFIDHTGHPIEIIVAGIVGHQHIGHEMLNGLIAPDRIPVLFTFPGIFSGHIDGRPAASGHLGRLGHGRFGIHFFQQGRSVRPGPRAYPFLATLTSLKMTSQAFSDDT